MNGILNTITRKIWRGSEAFQGIDRVTATADFFTLIYALPLLVGGTFWLFYATDRMVIQQNWVLLVLFFILMILFDRWGFFTILELRPGRYANTGGSFGGLILWSGLLLLGPTVLWLAFARWLVAFISKIPRASSPLARLDLFRSFTLNHITVILTPLVALNLYKYWGGQFPISGLGFLEVLPAFGAIFIHFALSLFAYSGYLVLVLTNRQLIAGPDSSQTLLRFLALAFGLPFLAYPFGIFAAVTFVQIGLGGYLFFVLGLLLVAALTQRLSRVVENSRQQYRQLEKLEQLGRSIVTRPLAASNLPQILEEHVPQMFPSARIAIWVLSEGFLLKYPSEWSPNMDWFWEWMRLQKSPVYFQTGDYLPWQEQKKAARPILTTPILEAESGETIGGIFIELDPLGGSWNPDSLRGLFPAVQSLSAQVASALRQAVVYEETLVHEQLSQELKLAGEIQASFFPSEIPVSSEWQLAVTILPARETSGDYFDFFPLVENKIGILIADVTDKGVGPSLYMALSRTLIRTYAIEYDMEPDVVFFATNKRILEDARANLFVTAFYGVLDQNTGELIYSNAGHNPPFLLRRDGEQLETLGQTGVPIGLDENQVWEKASIDIEPGDVLLLYTDGIPEAQNSQGDFYENARMIETAQCHLNKSAFEIQAAIIEDVQRFIKDAPQVDDITLLVLNRSKQ